MNGFAADVDGEQSPAIASANSVMVDKEPKVNDDDKVSYVSSIRLL